MHNLSNFCVPALFEQGVFMQGQTKEKWEELCALAAKEQDPVKLMALVQEINRILEQKEQRLKQMRKPSA